MGQAGAKEVGVGEVSSREIGHTEVAAGKVRFAQVVVAQVDAGQLDATEERPGKIERRSSVDKFRGECLAGRPVLEPVAQIETRESGIDAAERKFPPPGDGVRS